VAITLKSADKGYAIGVDRPVRADLFQRSENEGENVADNGTDRLAW
jgi:hypothetical protein